MAKQRPSPRVAPKKPAKAAVKAARPPAKAKAKAAAPAKATPARKTAPAVATKKKAMPPPLATGPDKKAVPAHPAVHDRDLAVEIFEKGFRALQQRKYQDAAQLFNSVLTQYPDEKELLERCRVFLAVCARHSAPPDATPKSFEERVYAATLSVNRGAYDEGLALLSSLERERPDHEHIQYMLAVVCTQRGETDDALVHLQKAIDLRPALRLQAGQDIDLEPLHDNPAFEALLEAAAAKPRGR